MAHMPFSAIPSRFMLLPCRVRFPVPQDVPPGLLHPRFFLVSVPSLLYSREEVERWRDARNHVWRTRTGREAPLDLRTLRGMIDDQEAFADEVFGFHAITGGGKSRRGFHPAYSTVTLLARLRGLSMSQPLALAA